MDGPLGHLPSAGLWPSVALGLANGMDGTEGSMVDRPQDSQAAGGRWDAVTNGMAASLGWYQPPLGWWL